jgi:hypothetical protein
VVERGHVEQWIQLEGRQHGGGGGRGRLGLLRSEVVAPIIRCSVHLEWWIGNSMDPAAATTTGMDEPVPENAGLLNSWAGYATTYRTSAGGSTQETGSFRLYASWNGSSSTKRRVVAPIQSPQSIRDIYRHEYHHKCSWSIFYGLIQQTCFVAHRFRVLIPGSVCQGFSPRRV